jgi:hypothetical protein
MACGLRRTSTSSPYRMLRVGFVHVKTLAVRNNPISKLYQLFRTRGRPYGLQDSLSTLRLSRSPFGSSTVARLDTGGWLTLTRRGLSPRKIRRAFPGAITPRLSRAFGAGLKSRVTRLHSFVQEVSPIGKKGNIQLTPPTRSAAFPPKIMRFSASPMSGHRLTKPTGSGSPTG